MMRSRISASVERQEEVRVEGLRSRELAARANGIEEILREFGVDSSIDIAEGLTSAMPEDRTSRSTRSRAKMRAPG
jgi:hypothetical protein